jgi:hypothetical protein
MIKKIRKKQNAILTRLFVLRFKIFKKRLKPIFKKKKKIILFNNSNIFFVLSTFSRKHLNNVYNLILSIKIGIENFFFEYLFLNLFLVWNKKEKIFKKIKMNSVEFFFNTNGKFLYNLLLIGIKSSRVETIIMNDDNFFFKYNFEKKKNLFYLKDSIFKKAKTFSNNKNALKSTNSFHEKLFMFFPKKDSDEKNSNSKNLLIWNTSKKINFD